MKPILAAIAILIASSAFAQTQTQTHCTANGNQIDCTSTGNSAGAQLQKDTDENFSKLGTAVGEAIARKRAATKVQHDVKQEDTATIVIPDAPETAHSYCSKNPTSTWYIGERESGKFVPCGEILKTPSDSKTTTNK